MTVRDLVAAAGGVTGLALFGAACVTGCAAWRCGGMRPVARDSDARPPVIGAWFWSKEELEPQGYQTFLDEAAARSPYTLLTTACRQAEVVEPRVHAQLAEAVRYAASRGLAVAWEVDVRLARQHFRELYPEELQEELVLRALAAANVQPVTPWTARAQRWGHAGGKLAAPPVEGFTVLTDGTYVRVAGARQAEGDPIQERFIWQGHDLEVDAVGVVAVRFAPDGSLAAFAAGGFKHLHVDGLDVTVPERVDIAFKRDADGRVRGVWQGAPASPPDGLRAFTHQWTRLPLPANEGAPQRTTE